MPFARRTNSGYPDRRQLAFEAGRGRRLVVLFSAFGGQPIANVKRRSTSVARAFRAAATATANAPTVSTTARTKPW